MILYKQFLQAMRIHKSSRYPFYRRFKPDHNLRNDGSTSGSALSQSREFGVDKHTTAELLEIQSTRISLQATREALALEAGQRHYFEEEVRRLNVDLDQWHEWASSHSERDTQLEVLISDCQKLQQENFWLRGEYEKLQIQVQENGKFRLDTTIPKDKQIKLLRKKLRRRDRHIYDLHRLKNYDDLNSIDGSAPLIAPPPLFSTDI